MWVGKPVLPSDYLLLPQPRLFHPDPFFGLVVDPKYFLGLKKADLEFIIRIDIHADPKFLTKKI